MDVLPDPSETLSPDQQHHRLAPEQPGTQSRFEKGENTPHESRKQLLSRTYQTRQILTQHVSMLLDFSYILT